MFHLRLSCQTVTFRGSTCSKFHFNLIQLTIPLHTRIHSFLPSLFKTRLTPIQIIIQDKQTHILLLIVDGISQTACAQQHHRMQSSEARSKDPRTTRMVLQNPPSTPPPFPFSPISSYFHRRRWRFCRQGARRPRKARQEMS